MPIVLQKQSPLAGLLAGVGQALSAGAGTVMEDAQRSKLLGQQILQKVLTGEMDPRYLATSEAEPFLREMGLDKNPQIMAIVEQGRAAVTPLEAPQTAEMPTAGAGLPGPAMNVPQPRATAKGVNDAILGENTARSLAAERAKKGIDVEADFQKQAALKQMDQLTHLTEEQAKTIQAELQKIHPDWEFSTEVNKDGWKVSAKTPDSTSRAAAGRTAILNLKDYETPRVALANHRTQTVKELQQILKGQLENITTFQDDSDPNLSPEEKRMSGVVRGIMQSIAGGQKAGKFFKPAEIADLYIGAVNKAISAHNESLKRIGRLVGISPQQTEKDLAEPVTFEEVSGRTREAWDKQQKALDEAKDGDPVKIVAELAAARAKDGQGNAPVSAPKPSETAAQTTAEKITKVHGQIMDAVVSARKSNPALTADQILLSLDNSKSAIREQFGLNDQEFGLLRSMAERAVNGKPSKK